MSLLLIIGIVIAIVVIGFIFISHKRKNKKILIGDTGCTDNQVKQVKRACETNAKAECGQYSRHTDRKRCRDLFVSKCVDDLLKSTCGI